MMSYREGWGSQDPKLPNIYSKLKVKYSKVPTNVTLITMRIIIHTMPFLGKITLPSLEDCSQSIHSWRIHL